MKKRWADRLRLLGSEHVVGEDDVDEAIRLACEMVAAGEDAAEIIAVASLPLGSTRLDASDALSEFLAATAAPIPSSEDATEIVLASLVSRFGSGSIPHALFRQRFWSLFQWSGSGRFGEFAARLDVWEEEGCPGGDEAEVRQLAREVADHARP